MNPAVESVKLPKIAVWSIWQGALIKEHGKEAGLQLLERIKARYAELYQRRPETTNKALRWHLEESILPGLSMYQLLREDGIDRKSAFHITEQYLFTAADVMKKQLVLFGKFPFLFGIFRKIIRVSMSDRFPQVGFPAEWVEGDDFTGFNITGCMYLKVLTGYGAPELTAAYCHADDYVFEALAPSIQWKRTQTLGTGGECCDFRFIKSQQKG